MRLVSTAAVAVALLLGAPRAEAQDADGFVEFALCDGYGPPSRNGDGMTVWAGTRLFGAPLSPAGRGDTRSSGVRLGTAGARLCDAALAAPALEPRYDLRRANLLRARALHKLAAGDKAGAAADLAASRAAVGPSDGALYRRSLAVGTDYVEAYALAMDGRKAEAAALARAAFDKRPYSRQSAFAAWLVLETAGARAEQEAHLRALTRLDPEWIERLYDLYAAEGRWGEALALYPQLKAPRLRQELVVDVYGRDTKPFYSGVRERMAAEAWWANRGAAQAYALAANGDPAAARAALAAARARLVEASKPPAEPTAKPGKKLGEEDQKRHAFETEAVAGLRAAGGATLERWAPLIEARARLAEGDAAGALAAVQAVAVEARDAKILADLLAALHARLPQADKAKVPPVPVEVAARSAADLALLMQVLPQTEWSESQPHFEDLSFRQGAERIRTGDDGVINILHHDLTATAPSAVEEVALLRAADLALRAGKPGVLVLDRVDTEHTTSNPNGMAYPTGYSTDLRVVLVDPAALPAAYAGTEWRVLDAAKLYAELEPNYPSRAEEKAAKKAVKTKE